jgi:hypothetical protein
MKLIAQAETFRVFDDVLNEAEWAEVYTYLQVEDFQPVHAQTWKKVWRLSDGMSLRGPTVLASAIDGDQRELPAGLRPYPMKTGIDRVISRVIEEAAAFEDLVGVKGGGWDRMTATATLYPQQTGLSWHLDGGGYTGAFIYYAHREWNAQWAGELLVADTSPAPGQMKRDHLDSSVESNWILEQGTGRYVMPKPNRLVVLRGSTLHKLQRVDATAGDHVRCTIGGFFLRAAVR